MQEEVWMTDCQKKVFIVSHALYAIFDVLYRQMAQKVQMKQIKFYIFFKMLFICLAQHLSLV